MPTNIPPDYRSSFYMKLTGDMINKCALEEARVCAEKFSVGILVPFHDRVFKYLGMEKPTLGSISNLLSALGQRMMENRVISLAFPPILQ